MVALLWLLACRPATVDLPADDSATLEDSAGAHSADTAAACPEPEGDYSLLAEGFGDGVLLGSWSDDAVVRMVGGDLGGSGGGMLASYSGDSLCWESGVTEAPLWWIHGASAGEWYAVGEQGTVLHAVDGVRQREDLATSVTLYGVYASADEVWAVGGDPFTPNSGEAWRRRDGAWAQVASGLPGVLFKVWEDWIVGDRVAYRIVEGGLVPLDSGERLLTVRGDDTDVYAVGGVASAVVQRWDGAAWASLPTEGLGAPLNGVWTAPGAEVFVAGFSGLMARRVGRGWEQPSPPLTLDSFHAAWGHCGEVLFVGGNLMSSGPKHATVGRYGPARAAVTVGACR